MLALLKRAEQEAADSATAVFRIEPSTGHVALNLKELWVHRELVYFLVWRDFKVRYKQTVLGVAWAIIQPFFTMLIFSLFFGRLARVPSDGIPYPLFAYTALVPWNFFANGLTQSSDSLVGSSNLIKKIYFPRLAIPVAAALSGAVDFGLALVVLAAMAAYYGVVPHGQALCWPAFLVLAWATSLGAGMWLSALNVKFRDVRHIMPFLIQLWMFATPVVYSSSLLPGHWRTLYGLNPMAGVVEGFRWALLGATNVSAPLIGVSTLTALGLFASGLWYFRRMERTFADVV